MSEKEADFFTDLDIYHKTIIRKLNRGIKWKIEKGKKEEFFGGETIFKGAGSEWGRIGKYMPLLFFI